MKRGLIVVGAIALCLASGIIGYHMNRQSPDAQYLFGAYDRMLARNTHILHAAVKSDQERVVREAAYQIAFAAIGLRQIDTELESVLPEEYLERLLGDVENALVAVLAHAPTNDTYVAQSILDLGDVINELKIKGPNNRIHGTGE